MSIDGADFRRVLGHFPTGVSVVTAVDDEGPAGMAIGSFASVSLDPPLVMFCPAKDSGSWLRMKEAGSFCVNVLGEDQAATCGVFASRAEDKFDDISWTTDATGAPVIPGSIAVMDCELHAIHDGGDHEIVVGLVKSLWTDPDLEDNPRGPLVFFQGRLGQFQDL